MFNLRQHSTVKKRISFAAQSDRRIKVSARAAVAIASLYAAVNLLSAAVILALIAAFICVNSKAISFLRII